MASDQSFYEAFRQAQINREIRSAVAATQVNAQQQRQQRQQKKKPTVQDNNNNKNVHNNNNNST